MTQQNQLVVNDKLFAPVTPRSIPSEVNRPCLGNAELHDLSVCSPLRDSASPNPVPVQGPVSVPGTWVIHWQCGPGLHGRCQGAVRAAVWWEPGLQQAGKGDRRWSLRT